MFEDILTVTMYTVVSFDINEKKERKRNLGGMMIY